MPYCFIDSLIHCFIVLLFYCSIVLLFFIFINFAVLYEGMSANSHTPNS